MQGPVGTHRRKFFRRSPTLRTARARQPRPTARPAAHGPRRHRPDVPGPRPARPGGVPAMTATTSRHASPAANPRTGWHGAALPNDPGLEALLADKRLSSTAKLVATVLVKHWAWYKPSCYPCNRSIAARCGYSPGHVARCLHELEQGGWIRREQQATGSRLIVLCWRGTPCQDAGGGSATVQGDPPAKARTELVVSVNERIEPMGSECPERSRPEERQPIAIPPALPAPSPAAAEPISTIPGGEKILPPLLAA